MSAKRNRYETRLTQLRKEVLEQISTEKGMKEARKEYSHLRQVIQKRMKSFKGTEFELTRTYQHGLDFPKLSEFEDPDQISFYLPKLKEFSERKITTRTGYFQYKEKSLETLHLHKYDFVNEDNFVWYGLFMQEYKDAKLEHVVISDEVAEYFFQHEVDVVNSTKEAFKDFLRESADFSAYAEEMGIDKEEFINKL